MLTSVVPFKLELDFFPTLEQRERGGIVVKNTCHVGTAPPPTALISSKRESSRRKKINGFSKKYI